MRTATTLLAAALSIALAGTGAGASAAVGDGPSRTFTARDLFSLEAAGDPQISPDGRTVAYVRSTFDIMTDRAVRSIWTVDAASGAQAPLVAGAGAAGGAGRPRWSPDGRRLAYVAADAAGRPQLFVRWIASGESARVAALPEAPGEIAWSPDGRMLAFTMLEPGQGLSLGAPLARPEGAQWAAPLKIIDRVHYREDGEGYLRIGYTHVFVVSAEAGSPRQLTFGPHDEAGPLAWTPDSRAVLFSSNRGKDPEREPEESDILQVQVADGAVTQLTHRVGPDGSPAVSPDGKLIAYVGYDDHARGYENAALSVMNRDGSGTRVLTGALDRSVGSPQWAHDGRSIYVDYADHGTTKVARVGLDGRIVEVATGLAGGQLDRPYSGGSFSVSDTGVVAFTQGSPEQPAEVAVSGGREETRRLTRLNADLFLGKTLARVQPLPVKSSFDGLPIDAWIMTPPGFDPARKYPLILEIHGGPFASYGPTWASELQLYAAAGNIVVYANPRGSTSYGEAFANRIDKNYPSHDFDDLISVVDTAIARGSVDPERLYVTGGSGGGVLTAWIVGKTHRFRAAVVQKPVINWSSFVLTADGSPFFVKYWFGKAPWEDPQGYWARSPLSLVGNVTTPTLVVVGEEDYRTPPSEAEQYYEALQLRKVPTALIRVPGASHEGLAARPSQLAAKATAILAWFERSAPGSVQVESFRK